MTEHGVKIWNTLMDEAVFRIKQRNNFTTVELTFHRDYVEYCLISGRGKAVGFNVRYELLPNEFDYRTYHPKDQFVRRPLIIIAFLTPFELLKKNANPYSVLGIMFLCGLLFCAMGYGLRLLLKRGYTALVTQP